MGIPTISATFASGGRSKGQSYTEAERHLALITSKVVLTATGYKDFTEEVKDEEEVISTFGVVSKEQEQPSVPGLCRAVYRSLEKVRLNDSSTVAEFPKVKDGERCGRDHTSINLLFRHAFKECKMDDVDQVFPRYGQKKTG